MIIIQFNSTLEAFWAKKSYVLYHIMFIMWYPQEGHDAMKLELFEHNQKAYEAAISMMAETGKAAIIHPTGTGKSLIAFKLAMEHPQASVYWLAPSSYIYHTQLENLQKLMKPDSSDKQLHSPANITFISYSTLRHNAELIEKIQPA